MRAALLIGSLLLLLSGLPAPADKGDAIQIKTELYMGLSDRNGKPIPKRKWQAFKTNELVKRLGGYTELPGNGYWINDDGKGFTEKSVVIVYVHEKSAEEDKKIDSLIKFFKKEFDQESVLQIDTEVAYFFK